MTSDATLARFLAEAAATRRDHPAVDDAGVVTTYAGLAARAGGVQAVLADHGVAPGDRVAIFAERGAAAAAALFGAWAAGAVAVVVNERLRPRQIAYVLRDAGVRVLLAGAGLLGRLPRPLESSPPLVDLDRPLEGALHPLPRGPRDLAQIIYTSGSTGLPKGVVFTHGALAAGLGTVATYLGLHNADRTAGLLALSTVYGLNQLMCSVATGATWVPERSPLIAQVEQNLREAGVTVLAAVPPLWLPLLALAAFHRPMPRLRLMQNAGGHLPADAVRRLRAAQPQARLFLQYGMTETFRSTFLPPDEVDALAGSMGRAMPGAEILAVRADGAPCATGETGELVHAGPTIAEGYWNAPEATARVFRPHPLRPAERAVFSGDLVKRDAGGVLWFVGREDRMIKTMGFRVGPDEVADVLHASGQVAEALVAPEDDPERGQRIVAWVVLAPGGSREALSRFCREELPSYMVPTRYEMVERLPRLPSGKYDVSALRTGAAEAEGA